MRLNINIKKSIETGQLVSNSYFHKFQDIFNALFFAIVFITIIIGPTKGIETEITTLKIILIAFVVILTIIGKATARKMSRLILINKQKINIDRDFFILLAEENSWAVVKEEENLVVLQTNNWLTHERQITIIIDKGYYYVNVMSFGNFDIKTPLYIKKDRQIMKQITEEITLHNKKYTAYRN